MINHRGILYSFCLLTQTISIKFDRDSSHGSEATSNRNLAISGDLAAIPEANSLWAYQNLNLSFDDKHNTRSPVVCNNSAMLCSQMHLLKTDSTDNQTTSQSNYDSEDVLDTSTFISRANTTFKKKFGDWSWVVFMGDSNMRHTYCWWSSSQMGGVASSEATKRIESSTYGLDRTDLEFGGRWADQELILLHQQQENTAQEDPLRVQKSSWKSGHSANLQLTNPNHDHIAAKGVDNSFRQAMEIRYNSVVNSSLQFSSISEKVEPIQRISFRFLHGSVDEFRFDCSNWHVPRHRCSGGS